MKRAKAPTLKEKKLHKMLISCGCPITGDDACLHHCVGSSAKHNKIHIGQLFVIPLSYDAHQGQHGIHGDRTIFPAYMGQTRKEIEKYIFASLVKPEWIGQAEYDAIMGYHR